MRPVSVTLLLSVALCAFVPSVSAQLPAKVGPKVCQDGAFVVHWLGILRDDGVPIVEVREALEDPGFNGIRSVPKEMVWHLASIVYQHKDTNIVDLVRAFQTECLETEGLQV